MTWWQAILAGAAAGLVALGVSAALTWWLIRNDAKKELE